jgi:hypothetical protein
MPIDKPTSAARSWVMTRSGAIIAVVLVLFLLHLIAAAALLDSTASHASGTPSVGYSD